MQHLFVHIPKTGGLFVHDVLLQKYPDILCYGGHTRIIDLHQDRRKRLMTSFTFVRNPYQRVLSAYFFLMKGGLQNKSDLISQDILRKYSCFEDFVMSIEKDGLIEQIRHIRPCHYYTNDLDGKMIIDHVFKLECNPSINSFFRSIGINDDLGMYNVEQRPEGSDKMDSMVIAEINRLYALDFDTFRYEKL